MPLPTVDDPLAAFIHLSSPDDPGNIVAQYDGWETALTGLETGDVISQSVQLQVSGATPPDTYQLVVGLYSPQTWQRLPVTSTAETVDSVTLSSIEVLSGGRP